MSCMLWFYLLFVIAFGTEISEELIFVFLAYLDPKPATHAWVNSFLNAVPRILTSQKTTVEMYGITHAYKILLDAKAEFATGADPFIPGLLQAKKQLASEMTEGRFAMKLQDLRKDDFSLLVSEISKNELAYTDSGIILGFLVLDIVKTFSKRGIDLFYTKAIESGSCYLLMHLGSAVDYLVTFPKGVPHVYLDYIGRVAAKLQVYCNRQTKKSIFETLIESSLPFIDDSNLILKTEKVQKSALGIYRHISVIDASSVTSLQRLMICRIVNRLDRVIDHEKVHPVMSHISEKLLLQLEDENLGFCGRPWEHLSEDEHIKVFQFIDEFSSIAVTKESVEKNPQLLLSIQAIVEFRLVLNTPRAASITEFFATDKQEMLLIESFKASENLLRADLVQSSSNTNIRDLLDFVKNGYANSLRSCLAQQQTFMDSIDDSYWIEDLVNTLASKSGITLSVKLKILSGFLILKKRNFTITRGVSKENEILKELGNDYEPLKNVVAAVVKLEPDRIVLSRAESTASESNSILSKSSLKKKKEKKSVKMTFKDE
jgi:hypothetical protein